MQKEILNLSNIGKDTTTYSISLIHYIMHENGDFKVVENPDSTLKVATPYLRIFPRRVTLAPGESQNIMLQCRRSANMKVGEYRSHLYFRSEKNYTPLGVKDSSKDSGISVRLIPIYGITIPVIVRTGETSTGATLSNLRVEQRNYAMQNLLFTINRLGNISTYGDIRVEFIPKQGKSYEIGLARGVGVYTCISRRNVALQLKVPEGLALKEGKLKVQYLCAEDGKHNVYAESELEM